MTEIMCTLTSAQILEKEQLVRQMCYAGMTSVRINTAHLAGVAQLAELAQRLKNIYPALNILIDTKGPEMRTTALAGDQSVPMVVGEVVTVEGTGRDPESTAQHIFVNYENIHNEVKSGDIFLVDDARIVLEVMEVKGAKIITQVTKGGELGSRKGVSVEGLDLALPALGRHDGEYLAFAAKSDSIDVVAHSFVRSAADVVAVKTVMGADTTPVIAKIENQSGIDNLDEILQVADGILIARGDLTAGIGAESVPVAQTYIAQKTKAAGKPLYLATNILPSMMHNGEPSSADIAGIAQAHAQGVDTMLLTNETAAGSYPLETVKTLAETLCELRRGDYISFKL